MKDGKINDMNIFSKVLLEDVLEIERHDGNWHRTAEIADNLGLK